MARATARLRPWTHGALPSPCLRPASPSEGRAAPALLPEQLRVELTPITETGDSQEAERIGIELPLREEPRGEDCLYFIDRSVHEIPRGLRHGDQVLTINGQSQDDLVPCVRRTFRFSVEGWPGGTAHVVLKRRGRVQAVNLPFQQE